MDLISTFNLTSISDVRAALNLLDLKPSKALGQNFLIDANILGIILNLADLNSADQVLEIGTGLGVLAEAMAKKVRRLITIEKDSRLTDFLKVRLKIHPNVEFVFEDALKLDLQKFWQSGINKMVANLPYSVGSAILADIFKSKEQPDGIVVTLQTEVARRLVAKPNTSDYSLLSIWCQLSYEGKIEKKISESCFYPNPDVQSAVVRLARRREKAAPIDPNNFFNLTKYAFGQRRKQLQKIISHAPPPLYFPSTELQGLLREMQIDPCARPEELAVEQWVELSDRIKRKQS